MIVLTREQIIRLHAELVTETGGSAGIRDEGMLSSALQAPFYCFDGGPRNIYCITEILQTPPFLSASTALRHTGPIFYNTH